MTPEAEEEETPCFCSSESTGGDGKVAAMDFLDEYWFFRNILDSTQMVGKPAPLDISSPSKAKEPEVTSLSRQGGAERDSAAHRIATRALLRTPSLPPRMERTATPREELSNTKLQHSYSSLDEHQPYSSSKSTTPSPSTARHRHPREIMKVGGSRNHGASNDYIFRKAFQEKKWKSLSDLECFEVQGFKDLGFVFEKDGLDASIARVIPGLRDRRPAEDDNQVISRPYLSEAWLMQRSAPPMLRLVDRGSVADRKEQLRFWARAVARNVQQEC